MHALLRVHGATTQTRRCAVNPLIGREFEGMEIAPAAHARKVLVVGGGIAGMVAATTAAARGHDVILCEKEGELGGILRTEAALPVKREMYELGRTYARKCERMGVDIRLNTEVDTAYADRMRADAVIVAVGSEPIPLPIPRDDDARVLSIDDLYLDGAKVGSEVVVLGGGLTGSECALNQARRGVKAHIVEMRGGLAIDANIRHRPILLAEIEDAGVDVNLNARGVRVTAQGVVVADADGAERLIPGDTVVCAIGQRSRTAAVDALRDAAPFVRIVGDAVRPANITAAVYEAYHAALDI